MDESDGTYAPRSPDLSALQKSFAPEPANSFYPLQPHSYQDHYAPNSVYPQTAPNHSTAYAPHFSPQHHVVHPYPPQTTVPARKASKHHLDDGDEMVNPDSIKRGPGRKPKKGKLHEKCDKLAPGVAEGIEVKTKFPVARIKRIMQADEDVGKVAQTTPTAVSKALELFMISVVTKAAAEGKAKGTKRVTAGHIKQAVEKDEQLDFLATIMQKVPDGPQPKKDEDSEEGGDGRKRKVVTRRRKKNLDG